MARMNAIQLSRLLVETRPSVTGDQVEELDSFLASTVQFDPMRMPSWARKLLRSVPKALSDQIMSDYAAYGQSTGDLEPVPDRVEVPSASELHSPVDPAPAEP